jgi:hypothetical protein
VGEGDGSGVSEKHVLARREEKGNKNPFQKGLILLSSYDLVELLQHFSYTQKMN